MQQHVGEVNRGPPLLAPGLRCVANIRTVVARNLSVKTDSLRSGEADNTTEDGEFGGVKLCSCFFTLHRYAGGSRPEGEEAGDSGTLGDLCYISEVVRDSQNPTWGRLALTEDATSGHSSEFGREVMLTICVWSVNQGQSLESAHPGAPDGSNAPSTDLSGETYEEDALGVGTDELLRDIEDQMAHERGAVASEPPPLGEFMTPDQVATVRQVFRSGSSPGEAINARLLMSVTVDLRKLIYSPPHSLVLPPDTIVLELEDGWYMVPPSSGEHGSLPGPSRYQSSSTEAFASFLGAARSKKPVRSTRRDLVEFLETDQKLGAVHAQADRLRLAIENQLKRPDRTSPENTALESIRASKLHRVHMARLRCERLRAILAETRASNTNGRRRLEGERDALLPRLRATSQAQMALVASKSMLREDLDQVQFDERKVDVLERRILQRRWQLVHGLRAVYPITQAPKEAHLQIARLSLPNSEYTGCEEEHVATALGFVCHCVLLCGRYLDVPLRYPMLPMGSRSVIQDTLSKFGVQQKFPLYSRGVERNRFDYGVFLLNKNVTQLLNSQGLEMITLRHTLPNLQVLLCHSPPFLTNGNDTSKEI